MPGSAGAEGVSGSGGVGDTGRAARRPLTWRLVTALLIVAVLTGVAGWGCHRVFPTQPLLQVLAPAALVPVVVALLARNRPLWLALLVNVVLWFAATVPIYQGLAPGLVKDLANAWQALLTTLLPAQPEPRLLILVHTVVWLASLVGAEIVTRTTTRAAAALPAVAAFGVALLLGVDGEGSNLPAASALVVLVAALALVRDGRPAHWLLAGLPAAGLLAGAALVVGPLLPIAAEPYNPRSDAELPPPVRVDSVSPLDRVTAWLQAPDRPLFTVKADKPANWRLAVLDRYDGVRWTSSARFQPTGGRVPADEWTGAAETVRQRVTVDGLPGTWLPAAERPESVTGVPGLAVDPGSGALLAAEPPGKGFGYEVSSRVARPSKEELVAAVPVKDAALTAFPAGPQEAKFRKLAQQAVKGADEPIKQAYRLQKYLRTSAAYDITAPPGHSLKGLEFFLETTHRGTSEQFASTFALMARTLGLPSRVVVGFRPGVQSGGVHQVKSGDVMAWAEIQFEGLGWRPFYPTPGRSGAKDDHEVVSSAIEESERLEGEFTQGGANRPKPSAKPSPGGGREPGEGAPLWVIVPAAAAGVLAVYAVVAVALPWWRRRRRRSAPGAEGRVLGAWQQTCDDLGLKDNRALTAEEVVERHPTAISQHLRPLADISNYVRYAPDGVADQAADEAWRRSDAVRAEVRRSTPLKRRVRRRLLLR
ncbi:transglutaminaseTgpA domain-containing protein [Nonomuraea typhae]|uniref:TransglutaminaseTgpA domain-containing protein n=1 Tax=Nonomuraea typhae TaxID=2603600 RepID=A0ABW7YNX1_9ACTN